MRSKPDTTEPTELALFCAGKRYGDQTIFEDFSLTFPAEKTVCLFGPSGCGKTTLLHCIAGLEPLSSGKVVGAARRISFVFQEDRLLPWATAEENVAAVLSGRRKETLACAREWLRKAGLSGAEGKRPAQLSGGMRRRASIVRALAYGGDLLLLDEPFRALDAESKERMISLIQTEASGKRQILVTHDETEARRLADVICVLNGPPMKVIKYITKSSSFPPQSVR